MSAEPLLERPELALELIDRRARGENFPVASLLAPREARPHLRAIYGFARLVDTLGDEAAGDRDELLDELERELDGPPRSEIMRRLRRTIEACALPREPFARLIEANRLDQRKTRYETWDDLRRYCALSAEPVGRLVLGVYGRADDPDLVARSDDVCTGLQLVNFLQDPPRDLALGRVYLPQEDLRAFGVTREHLEHGVVDGPVRRLLAFEVARTRETYRSAAQGVRLLHPTSRPCIETALALYGGILDEVERADYQVLDGRVSVSRPRRLAVFARRLTAAQLARVRVTMAKPNSRSSTGA